MWASSHTVRYIPTSPMMYELAFGLARTLFFRPCYLHLHKWYWNASVTHHSTYSGCLMCDWSVSAPHIKKLCQWLFGCRSSAVEKLLQLKLGALGIQGGCYFLHNMFRSCSRLVVPECLKLQTVYANYLTIRWSMIAMCLCLKHIE